MKNLRPFSIIFLLGLLFAINEAFTTVEVPSLALSNVESEIFGKPTDDALISHFKLTNVNTIEILVYEKMEVIKIAEGHTLGFCWGEQCNSNITSNFTSETGTLVAAGKDAPEALSYIDLYTNGCEGITVVKSTFFNFENAEDEVSYSTTFTVLTVGVADNSEDDFSISQPYPNPSTGQFKMDFKLPDFPSAEMNVYNSLGGEVGSYKIPQGITTLTFDARELSPGSYYCIINYGSNVIARKINIIK